MDYLRNIVVVKDNLPFDVSKPISDMLSLCNFAAVKESEDKENIAGELYLTDISSDKALSICCAYFIDGVGNKFSAECPLDKKGDRGEWARCAKISVLSVMKQAHGLADMPWGVLTGVRPGKLAKKILRAGEDPEDILMEKYLLPHENATLISDIVKLQNRILPVKNKDIALYIGVPYCPSRCLYCSFPRE